MSAVDIKQFVAKLAADLPGQREAQAPPLDSWPIWQREEPELLMTDGTNAEVFAWLHGEELRWVSDWGVWLRFDGRRWKREAPEQIIPVAIRTARWFFGRAAEPGLDREKAALLAQHATRTESAGRLESMIRLAKGYLAESSVSFDRDRYALNVENGTLDLRTGQLRPHRVEDMLTKIAPVEFDPAAECPRFEQFLERVLPDPDLRGFVQRFAGYCLTGDVGEQCLAFFFGRGANGKTTLLNILLWLAGEYSKAGAPDLLLAKNGEAHPTEQADLQGARLVVCQEVEAGRAWAERTVKALTGGDRIKARFMRCDFFEFEPTHKIIVAANHRPKVRGQDHAIWRRIKLVPFDVKIPKSEQNADLVEELLGTEAAGILRWAVDGCRAWQRSGLGEPPAVVDATADCRADQDHLGHFIEDVCEIEADGWANRTALYRQYQSWCLSNGETAWKPTNFYEGLSERDGLAQAKVKGERVVKGVRLRQRPGVFPGGGQ